MVLYFAFIGELKATNSDAENTQEQQRLIKIIAGMDKAVVMDWCLNAKKYRSNLGSDKLAQFLLRLADDSEQLSYDRQA